MSIEICTRNVANDPAGSICPVCAHHVIMHATTDEGFCGGCALDISLEDAKSWSRSFSHFPPDDDDPDVIGYTLVDNTVIPVFRSWGAAQRQKYYLAMQLFRECTSSSRIVQDSELRDAIRTFRKSVIDHRPDTIDTHIQKCNKCFEMWPCKPVKDGLSTLGIEI